MLITHAVELNNKKINFNSRNSPFMKLHQIANSFIKDGDTVEYFKNDPKLEALIDIVEESGDQKLIVWSPYHAQLEAIKVALHTKKITYRMLHGKLSHKQKDESKLSFQTDAKIKVLVANPEVGGLGLNLQCASVEVFMSNWWKPDIRAQAEDRAYRPGQTRRVTIIDLVAKGTVEVKIIRDINQKQDTENQIIKPTDLMGEEI
jgi:SNF2 family DNA or RNA helicase